MVDESISSTTPLGYLAANNEIEMYITKQVMKIWIGSP
jgi:hypothetical protein